MLAMARTRLADARLAARWRVLDAAHQKRNLAEYEGVLDVEESGIAELCAVTAELIADVAKLVGAPKPKR